MELSEAVFLFDVDGTLLQAGNRTHTLALRKAVEGVCARCPDLDTIPLAGRTDSEILRDVVTSVGCELEPGMLRRLFEQAAAEFEATCAADLSTEVLPGVLGTLTALSERGAAIGLVTGNIQAIAWRKMEAAGLRRFFGFGAFGDESSRRADLPPLAIERAGRWFAAERRYLIGDTPLDIDCGLACGLKTVAVATGRYTLDELRAAQPWLACATLPEFLEALLTEEV
jgi:phosphoglycolate phosphatase